MPDTDDATATLTQYTDPMCTWCWGSEPIVRRLRTVYGDQLRVEYVLGGLVEDFETFYDAANDISEPSEVAPHWLEASERHGMPVDTTIFETDPAHSTYPASVAFAAARQQDRALANRYLRRLREAYATQVRNTNRREEQLALAEDVGLDVDAFEAALDDGSAREDFERDLARARNAGVRAFPTYDVTGPDGAERADGFQSFDALAGALEAVAPSLERSSPPEVREFVREHGTVATQEVAEVYDASRDEAERLLDALADEGVVRRQRLENGSLWHAADRGGA